MPHPPERKAETRRRILQGARRLFNQRGFAEVSIEEVMAAAGLTRGGFYNHFSGKEELYALAIGQFARDHGQEAWQPDLSGAAAPGPALAHAIVDAYLSRAHFEDRDGSCPMVALPSDTARSNGLVKGAFEQVLVMMTGAFESSLRHGAQGAKTVRRAGAERAAQSARAARPVPANASMPSPATARGQALALAALCVGGMVLARAVQSPRLADELLRAARRQATECLRRGPGATNGRTARRTPLAAAGSPGG
jgi:AcrR family transcriptional regulator